ncbi:hypothetical protein [Arthrobacter sp. SX1312]|uniref:hypothetical protein n=1 Tax=Arthrobacter sp. SX1312 TaxID=2058896 RepID=UPI0021587785|nr:hypothetical protein [Arthrobacter sp. SX1312]
MIRYNVPIVLVRKTGNEEQRHELLAVVNRESLTVPVDADIEEGDIVERRLPNGKTATYVITDVTVFQSPFGGRLDHTEATFEPASRQTSHTREGDVFNVHATNVQLATGNRSRQTMNVGQTADQLVLVIRGISELLRELNLAEGRDADLHDVEQEAIADITSSEPTAEGVRRFYDWVVECVKDGGSAAVVAAITAASSALLLDAETLLHSWAG